MTGEPRVGSARPPAIAERAEPFFRTLDRGCAHVWLVPVPACAACVEADRDTLAEDERQRAGRFVRDVDRGVFITARATLRRLLGAYLDCRPAELAFGANAFGKPVVREPAGAPIGFNISHSGGFAAFAFGVDVDVGIDIEDLPRADRFSSALTESIFDAEERRYLERGHADGGRQAMLLAWTRKEALLKAAGVGLSFPLHRAKVPLGPLASRQEFECPIPGATTSRWTLIDLSPELGIAASLVLSRPDIEPKLFGPAAGGRDRPGRTVA